MAREIAIREEYLIEADESMLKMVMKKLSQQFLLIDLGDYRIEVHEKDYATVSHLLEKLKHDIESKVS